MKNGGSSIIAIYGSLAKLLESIYPQYEWLPWRFSSLSPDFWNNKENQLKYINWLSQKLNIQSMEDWYKVKFKVVKNNKK